MSFQTTSQQGIYPDLVFPYDEVVPNSLVADPRVSTVAGIIEGDKPQVRVPYVASDPTSGFVKEGSVIADGGGALDEVLVTTGKIATLVTQTNESASFDTASQLIAAGVSRSIVTSADRAFLNNPKAADGTEQMGPVGVLATTGINAQAIGKTADVIDGVADMKALIGTNGGSASAILVNYKTEAMLRKMKDSTGGTYILGNPSQSDPLAIFGMPVIVTSAMPDNEILMVTASEIVVAAGSVTLSISTDALFSSDSLVRRATWRFGAKVVHPNRLGLLTLSES